MSCPRSCEIWNNLDGFEQSRLVVICDLASLILPKILIDLERSQLFSAVKISHDLASKVLPKIL